MAAKLSSASFEFEVSPGRQPQSAARESLKRFNVVVMGDFTGRSSRGSVEPLAARRPVPVDYDNFEAVFAQLGVRLRLAEAAGVGAAIELSFAALEGFHPDKLLVKASPLQALFEARQQLLNPATAEQGKTALQSLLGAAVGSQPVTQASAGPAKAESDGQTMARLLGGKPASAAPAATALSPAEQFIRQLVKPHVTPAAEPQSGALSAVDLELAKRLRAILHHPDFQALEAAWRAADLLVRQIGAVEEVGILLLDVTRAEMQAELLNGEPAEASPLLRILRDRKVGLVAGNYVFGESTLDLQALVRLAEISKALKAPFLATASARLVGCDSFALHSHPDEWTAARSPEEQSAWEKLRKSPAAEWLGLAAPRFLLRQPYGKSGDAIASFPFEEMPGTPLHESFLWGHPGVLCASVLVEGYASQLADEVKEVDFPENGEIGDLPAHRFHEDGETVIKPYAEAWLTDRAADRMIAGGIMPLLSRKDFNAIHLPRLQSISLPARPLAIQVG